MCPETCVIIFSVPVQIPTIFSEGIAFGIFSLILVTFEMVDI